LAIKKLTIIIPKGPKRKRFEGKELGFRRTGMIRVWCTAEDKEEEEGEEEESKGASEERAS
jgi:hypothetical protein